MAAYCQVNLNDLVTCGLTACTLGSAPGPTLGNKYGKPLPLSTNGSISKQMEAQERKGIGSPAK